MPCDGCVRPILVDHPFYSCVQCEFFLHRFCAELPQELPHPSHPMHVLVGRKFTKPNYYIKCNDCACITNGMFFSCKLCTFHLDFKCAMTPNMIKHEAHNHSLTQVQTYSLCNGCGKSKEMYERGPGTTFGCEDCEFYLHKGCALLPAMVNHRWDPHPIPLVYPPVKDHPDIFYCEICEEEIDPNYWFYFCGACDQSFHLSCLRPYYGFSNIKFGATMKIDDHQHSLTFVGMKKYKFPHSMCSSCGHDIPEGFPILECETCSFPFRLCMKCSLFPSTIKHLEYHTTKLLDSLPENPNERIKYTHFITYPAPCSICGTVLAKYRLCYFCYICRTLCHPSCVYPCDPERKDLVTNFEMVFK